MTLARGTGVYRGARGERGQGAFQPAQDRATHQLISEGGGLRGRHVVIRRLERKLLHFLILVQMNHLQETPELRQEVTM